MSRTAKQPILSAVCANDVRVSDGRNHKFRILISPWILTHDPPRPRPPPQYYAISDPLSVCIGDVLYSVPEDDVELTSP